MKAFFSSRTPVAQALKVVIMSVSNASQNLSNFPLFPHLQILNLLINIQCGPSMMDSVDLYPSKPPIDITIDILFYYIPEVDIPGLGLDNGQSISCMTFL